MNKQKKSVWPFVLMMIYYAIMLSCSAILLLFGLAFGTEAYRSDGIPYSELAIIIAPLAISLILLLSTIMLWNKGKYKITYILFGISLAFIFLMLLSLIWLAR